MRKSDYFTNTPVNVYFPHDSFLRGKKIKKKTDAMLPNLLLLEIFFFKTAKKSPNLRAALPNFCLKGIENSFEKCNVAYSPENMR